jgi:hypothetical protein
MHTGVLWVNLKERYHLAHIGICERKIIKTDLRHTKSRGLDSSG